MELRVVEFFAGIGGAACALRNLGQVVAAIDINTNARQIYELNFPHPYLTRTIESLVPGDIVGLEANAWWVSAPCQPFTRRGTQRDELDPRSQALLRMIQLVEAVLPEHFMLENVIGFRGSNTHRLLVNQLKRLGYSMAEVECCPTQIGIPNRRPRFYLVASRLKNLHAIGDFSNSESEVPQTVSDFVEPQVADRYDLSAEDWSNYGDGLNVVTPSSTSSNCFTSAYGRSLTRSGSYLRESTGKIRRFTPFEISRLLGFQSSKDGSRFVFPDTLQDRQLWKLIGNSISIYIVRKLIRQFVDSP